MVFKSFTMKKQLILFLVTLMVVGCSQNDTKDHIIIEPMESFLIGLGSLTGDEGIEAQNLVITDASAWNEWVEKMNSINDVSQNLDVSDLDFENFDVAAVFGPVFYSGSHAISLEVFYDLDSTSVYTTYSGTHPDSMAITVLSQPFAILGILKREVPVVFLENE